MLINEMFLTIQGEGAESGIPTFFIRTGKCNLKCKWCDTNFKDPVTEMKVSQIVGEITRSGVRHVCITGGEPLLEPDFPALEEWLLTSGYDAVVETNGSVSIKGIRCKVNMDVKPPSSGMKGNFMERNFDYIKPNDQIKFVISNRKDYLYAVERLAEIKQDMKVVFMPVWNPNHTIAKRLAKWIIKDKLNVRLSLQVNKILVLK